MMAQSLADPLCLFLGWDLSLLCEELPSLENRASLTA
jgi:hypothetical protein